MWTAIVGDYRLSISSDQLSAFRRSLSLIGIPTERVSDLLWFDLYVIYRMGWVAPEDVLEGIRTVEIGKCRRGVKRAAPFLKPPLQGLWHQHYFSPRFMAANMRLGLGKGGLTHIVDEVMDPSRSAVVTQEMINELAYRVTTESFERRAAENKLTGEWIVFAKTEGKKYYLCLATHETGDQGVFDRIMDHCIRDFADLPLWLKAGP